jgi:hypothetical protein
MSFPGDDASDRLLQRWAEESRMTQRAEQNAALESTLPALLRR